MTEMTTAEMTMMIRKEKACRRKERQEDTKMEIMMIKMIMMVKAREDDGDADDKRKGR